MLQKGLYRGFIASPHGMMQRCLASYVGGRRVRTKLKQEPCDVGVASTSGEDQGDQSLPTDRVYVSAFQ